MGTRGVWGFILDDKKYFAYNHWDSYPSGLGANLAGALHRRTTAETLDTDLEQLKTEVRALTLVDSGSKPTPEQQEALREYFDPTVSSRQADEWYALLRSTQGDLEATLKCGYMIDNFSFGYEGLFCEWGYVIDLDALTFTVYKGCGETPPTEGLWASPDLDESGYAAITPVKTLTLLEVVFFPVLVESLESELYPEEEETV